MLKIKTKLKESNILGAGIGLFSNEFIAKDTIIWEFTHNIDKCYTEDEFSKFNELEKEFMTTYCFMFNKLYILCTDNARFFNHSDTPNCYSSEFNEQSLGYTKALRDIQIGEELLDNYQAFGLNEQDMKFNSII
jgi:SET domain-containing protein